MWLSDVVYSKSLCMASKRTENYKTNSMPRGAESSAKIIYFCKNNSNNLILKHFPQEFVEWNTPINYKEWNTFCLSENEGATSRVGTLPQKAGRQS